MLCSIASLTLWWLVFTKPLLCHLLVRLRHLHKSHLHNRGAAVAIGVQLTAELAVGGANLGLARVLGHAEHLVRRALRCRCALEGEYLAISLAVRSSIRPQPPPPPEFETPGQL